MLKCNSYIDCETNSKGQWKEGCRTSPAEWTKGCEKLCLDSDKKSKGSFSEQVLDPSRKAGHGHNLVNGPGNLAEKKKKKKITIQKQVCRRGGVQLVGGCLEVTHLHSVKRSGTI